MVNDIENGEEPSQVVCVCVCVCVCARARALSCLVVSDSLCSSGLWPARLLCPWDLSGKNTGVGCHFLLQRVFLTTTPVSAALRADSLLAEPLRKRLS